MKELTSTQILRITKKAPLKLSQIDSKIIGFTVTGSHASACKKLQAAGYEAETIGYGFIKIRNVNFSW